MITSSYVPLSAQEAFRALCIAAEDNRHPQLPRESFCSDCGTWARTVICRCGADKFGITHKVTA